ncbi:hypothetical protein SAMN02799636_05753 [Methylobacterium sp. 275MFSha3.1]|uniref:hypothetical protein n=1 Tax=Methylobacterium sp. 275MFSha3.1 TaxID=1502746 RepID=UPI0008A7D9B5|nr:hypothetical protein [Methylobacterium sp. 275MFSha3.1]SEI12442.1 hypothetical protein SAMN02799636_05753 [Methylobacterium sp. 275MFSha3.1]
MSRPNTESDDREADKKLLMESGLFDIEWYGKNNPELSGVSLLDHYLDFGGYEGRAAGPTFDGGWYLRNNPDVASAGAHPLLHYIKFGRAEGRPSGPAPDDLENELESEQDRALRKSLIMESGLFDIEWYGKNNPELSGISLLDHYLDFGGYEGRAAGPSFDGGWYLRNNPDVASAGAHPLLHYIKFGRAEGRFIGLNERQRRLVIDNLTRMGGFDCSIDSEGVSDWISAITVIRGVGNGTIFSAWKGILSNIRRAPANLVFVSAGDKSTNAAYFHYLKAATSRMVASDDVLFVVCGPWYEPEDPRMPRAESVLKLSDHTFDLPPHDVARLVETLIFALRPKTVFNFNCVHLWEVMRQRGAALSNISDLVAFLPEGFDGGKAAASAEMYFRDCFDSVKKFFVVSEREKKRLIDMFFLAEAISNKIHVVPEDSCASVRCLTARS